ncbi:MAG: acyloxyacyl hydrolase [Acidobacteriota bacterium]|nr:MAG: acyloxyacyl hydrolase [Acidobacteriota bacterium]
MDRLPSPEYRMFRLRPVIIAIALLFVGTHTAFSQSGPKPPIPDSDEAAAMPTPEPATETESYYRLRTGMNEFGAFVGAGPSMATFTGLLPSEARNRYLIQGGFRYGRVLYVGETGAVEYMVEATPLNIAGGNVVAPDPLTPAVTETRTAYGIGVAPVGVRYILRPQKKVKIFGAVNLGMIGFNEVFPVPRTRKFNFTTEVDLGVMVWSRKNKAMTLGFKYNHISNAGTAELNPGINTAIFYVGYSVFK